MISRAGFLYGVAGATTIATGGLDLWDPSTPQIRVLVATDVHGEMPQVASDGTFTYGGKRWRGAPSTVGSPDGRMMLVTTIDVDQYLQGVIPLETPAGWPPAALQAQAIVARTFALARRNITRPYDVQADQSDQRWGGVDAEAASTNAAVQSTRGRTLLYGGGPAAVFYSSCCGGHTADVVATWGGVALPYLRGVEDPHCVAAPDYRWSRSVPLERVVAILGSRTGGTLTGASLLDVDSTGRAREVELSGAASATLGIADFRRALGYDVVRSSWVRSLRIESADAAPYLVIDGSGRGHGVGLCQWGTRFFAESGASAAEILAFYFPGTSVSGG